MSSLHQIKVLGRELQVRSTAPTARVREIEQYVNSRIEEVQRSSRNSDSLGVAILALLNIAESLLDLSAEVAESERVTIEKTSRLINCIENTTGESSRVSSGDLNI